MTFQDIFKSAFLENVTIIPVFDMVLAMACAFAVGLYIFSSISAAIVTNHAICVNFLSRQRPVNTLAIRFSSYFRLRKQNVATSYFDID